MTVRIPIIVFVFSFVSGACHSLNGYPPYTLRGSWHHIKDTDSLNSIADRYGVSSAVIQELNDVADDNALHRRAMLFVPQEQGRFPGKGRQGAPLETKTRGTQKTAQQSEQKQTPTRSGACGGKERPCLQWPVAGIVMTEFEKKGTHDGIDIKAAKGTRINAAAKGVVLYSGNQIKGYGNLIIIRHDDGLITVYAHNDRNLVKEGDIVGSGDPVGEVGQTGSARVPHLHFEVRKKEQPTNPLDYLKPR